MSTEYTPVEGDLVRVVMEGEVSFVSGRSFNVGGLLCVSADRAVSIEKIEPPVPAWQAGDVLTNSGRTRIRGFSDEGKTVWRNSQGEILEWGDDGYDSLLKHDAFRVVPIIRGGKLVDHRAEAG